ncbi:hypothetical protein FHR24_001899 [Wenyingzhuangia heitensis]|uniref:Glycosyl transferase family 2 n=1 Tax=Wenyingzhuangia heitensis TaxID=1487859 RepID=A0ABX0UD82_9FLAO|nr:glycosyltransferase family 2 protein [Wenyingzhuangia heitensis]NIJ45431.1 hypothetical protein [Wenyingzhuangia heitensis]
MYPLYTNLVRSQLKNLKLLVDYLLTNNYKNIIIDNNSSYKPLLAYYESLNNSINIIRSKKNDGHMVFWKQDKLFKKFGKGYYVVTDPDILPIDECPMDFLSIFLNLLIKLRTLYKVGFSLKLDDIPETYPFKNKVLEWEKQFWKTKTKGGNFIADIDTTFALYRPKINILRYFYKGLRTDFPYQARHFGWYINPQKLTEEQVFYNKEANSSSSWNIDDNASTNF